MVDKPLTTNGVREKLKDLGAILPSRQAVAAVARLLGQNGPTYYWLMVIPDYQIKQAITACRHLTGDESNREFAKHCNAKAWA
jgi:hypothetical protein